MSSDFAASVSALQDEFFADNRLRRDVLHDLAWALINAREFTYNH